MVGFAAIRRSGSVSLVFERLRYHGLSASLRPSPKNGMWARESALRDGARVTLPLSGDLESEQLVRDQLRTKLGVDPLDIEAVMEISFPRP